MAERICAAEGCERPWVCRGFCDWHYRRWLKYGDPLHPHQPKGPSQTAVEQRFWDKVAPAQADECWNWIGSRNTKGYGQIGVGGRAGRPHAAHRVAYEMLRADIPEGLHLDHLCRNPSCVNPWHLEPVTLRVNSLRGTSIFAVRAAQSECIHGHPFDEANTYVNPTNGFRQCRTCIRERSRRRRQRSTP